MQYICAMSDIYPFGSECSYMSYSHNEQTKQNFNLPSVSSLAAALDFAFPDNYLAKRLVPTCPAYLIAP